VLEICSFSGHKCLIPRVKIIGNALHFLYRYYLYCLPAYFFKLILCKWIICRRVSIIGYLHYRLRNRIPKISWEWNEPILVTVSMNQSQNCHRATHNSSWRFCTTVSLCVFKRRHYVAAYKINSFPATSVVQIFVDMLLNALSLII
jgi:hypothetical protein